MLAVSYNRLPVTQPVYSFLPLSIGLRGIFCGYLVSLVVNVNAQQEDQMACLPLNFLSAGTAVATIGTICFGVGYVLARIRLVKHPGTIAIV